ncbi:MAG: zinc ribbon domain-containing protein [Thermoplasmata archaeon]|nr:MAG: zinc ribbon domain-containing protein [Thermoplasmata archaeon]
MPFCEKCGTQIAPDVNVCPNCGQPQVVTPAAGAPPQPQPQPPPQQMAQPPYPGPPGGPPPGGPGGQIGYGRMKIDEAIRQRSESDRLMTPLWALAPLIAWIVMVAVIFLILIAAYSGIDVDDTEEAEKAGEDFLWAFVITVAVGFAVFAAVVLYPWYLMIKRRTTHFQRERHLREGIIELIGEKGAQGVPVSTEMATLNSLHAEANSDEVERSPILNIIIMIILPWVGAMYVLYFLMKDIFKHHNRDIAIMQQTQAVAQKMGRAVVVPSWQSLPPRNFGVYLILSCCIPLFGIYWQWVIIKDYNDHFQTQWRFEDQLHVLY